MKKKPSLYFQKIAPLNVKVHGKTLIPTKVVEYLGIYLAEFLSGEAKMTEKMTLRIFYASHCNPLFIKLQTSKFSDSFVLNKALFLYDLSISIPIYLIFSLTHY